MFAPQPGDLLIRLRPSSDTTTFFVVVDPMTDTALSKAFPTLREAAVFAAGAAPRGATIWQENLDLRQREVGPPVRLPIRTSGPARRSA